MIILLCDQYWLVISSVLVDYNTTVAAITYAYLHTHVHALMHLRTHTHACTHAHRMRARSAAKSAQLQKQARSREEQHLAAENSKAGYRYARRALHQP